MPRPDLALRTTAEESDPGRPPPRPATVRSAPLRPTPARGLPRIPPDIETAEPEASGETAAEPKLQRRTHSILKAVTWRATATIDTFIISYLVTGKLTAAGTIVSFELMTKILYYYLHERAWARVTLWLDRRRSRNARRR